MTLLSGFVLGMAAVICLMEFWILPHQQDLFEQMLRILENDRDAARNEAKVYRGVLFPALPKIEREGSNPSPVAATGKPEGSPVGGSQPSGGKSFLSRRPFRIRFKENTARTNTRQTRTDALASALEKIPVQEKSNA